MEKFCDKWIAVDWGTSSFRAYLIQNNEVSDTIETKDGMKFVKSHLFEQTLLSLIDRWLDNDEITEIISIFDLKGEQIKEGKKLIRILYNILIDKDASLIEINPLIITKEKNLICLDAKMNFDDNAIFRRPEILKLRDLNEEDPAEIEASKYDLASVSYTHLTLPTSDLV